MEDSEKDWRKIARAQFYSMINAKLSTQYSIADIERVLEEVKPLLEQIAKCNAEIAAAQNLMANPRLLIKGGELGAVVGKMTGPRATLYNGREIAWPGGYGYFDHQADSLVYAFKHCSDPLPPHQASDHEIAALYALEHLSKEKNMASETTPKTLQTYDPTLANVEFKNCTFNNIDRGIRHPITLNGVTIEASRSDPDAFIQPVRRDSLQLGDLFYYLDGGEAGDPWEVAPEDCDWQDEMGLMSWGVDCDVNGGADMVVLVQTRAERIQEAKDEIARLESLGNEPEARGDRTSPEFHDDGDVLLVDHTCSDKLSSEEWSRQVSSVLASNARIDEKAERNRVVLQGNWPGCDDPDW